MIFLNYKEQVEKLTQQLKKNNYFVESFSKDCSQEDRNMRIQRFSEDDLDALVSTDILARGIDFPNVKNVINYDCPFTMDLYFHRIGRTGRLGQEGNTITFIDLQNDNYKILLPLYIHLKAGNFEIPKLIEEYKDKHKNELRTIIARYNHSLYFKTIKEMEFEHVPDERRRIQQKNNREEMNEMFEEHYRKYSMSARKNPHYHIENISNESNGEESNGHEKNNIHTNKILRTSSNTNNNFKL